MQTVMLELDSPEVQQFEQSLYDDLCKVISEHQDKYMSKFGDSKNDSTIYKGILTKCISKTFMGFPNEQRLAYANLVPFYVNEFLKGGI